MKDVQQKHIVLRNYVTGMEHHDTLHTRHNMEGVCTRAVCNGALMLSRRTSCEPRPREEVVRLAKEFIDEYYHSIKRFGSDQHKARWSDIVGQIEQRGVYDLTATELVYGTKLAWRNAARCIGRIQWSKLQVFDCRCVTTASGMFDAICTHIKYATNKGNIRSAITIFPPRTDGRHDYRVWNSQLLSYAGYRNPDGSVTGDPLNVEFTEVCLQLGWRPEQKTRFDILPLVLSANGHDPEWFDLPEELVFQVKITHPHFDWFEELGLQWYAVPAVSSMLFDCGGLQFPAAPFNGWYMVTEIGARDLGDTTRYNQLEVVAQRMGLDTRSHTTLWKDKALVELNLAVLHSFQVHNVTIVDHHTASETFMKHYETELRVRGGCPADWVWIVPPMSGSATPVFHQEMSIYYLSPSYEYQDPAWKSYDGRKKREATNRNSVRKNKRKFRFKEIARAVKFTSKLFGKALSKRIKATILYATETGKSESYANKLGEIFGHTFNAQVHNMQDYDIINIEHEALVLVVTSTFGNGDPPENGEKFAKSLYDMKTNGGVGADSEDPPRLNRSLSFMRMSSMNDTGTPMSPSGGLTTQTSCPATDHHMKPLSNVRFAVFALGSSAYPNFCAFGTYVDNLLGELGGERLLNLTCGDELAGQEQQFNLWAAEVFKTGCETFCLDDEGAIEDATAALQADGSGKNVEVKLVECDKAAPLHMGLSRAHCKRAIKSVTVKASRNLHHEDANRYTQQVIFDIKGLKDKAAVHYSPGDHLAVMPCNSGVLVQGVLDSLGGDLDPDTPVRILVMKETHTPNGLERVWEDHDRLPAETLRGLLTRYLDITTPPTPNFLRVLAAHAVDNTHRERLELLASDAREYEEWKHRHYPHLQEVLQEFPSVRLPPSVLVSQLPLLQPRFYSISSSPAAQPGELHLTVAVVVYRTQDGEGPEHFGVCSNYLKALQPGHTVYCFVRNTSGFHLPEDTTRPIILVGPGTGIAPFRGFWQHRSLLPASQRGSITLYFGCRTRALDLYAEEKQQMLAAGVLTDVHLALSREPGVPKTYVQDQLVENGRHIVRILDEQGGHFYVCGDCTMADHVYQKLKAIFLRHSGRSEQDVENFMLQLRDENRYHEDIFGITLRTEEVHKQKGRTARDRLPLAQSLSATAPSLE